MRLMGIDYGTKRVGIALSDEGGSMSFPHAVLPNTGALVEEVVSLAEREHVDTIVVGFSLDREGRPNAVQAAINAFIDALRLRTGVPIVSQEERYTTQESLRIQGRTAMTDASAAALILDSYITRVKNQT